MNTMYGGSPSDWIARDGLPARCLGPRGMPSYEHLDGDILVYDLMVVASLGVGLTMATSRWYSACAFLAPDGPAPIHAEPFAWFEWRPQIYNWKSHPDDMSATYWQTLGSQQELAWRFGLMEALHVQHFDGEFSVQESNLRADRLLRETLSEEQRLDMTTSWGQSFRCRGGKTGRHYEIEMGNGFAWTWPSGEPYVSYCCHPDAWIPHADVALATKLQLEDEDGERDLLAAARGRVVNLWDPGTARERQAARIEAGASARG